jgi:hypothetical protein
MPSLCIIIAIAKKKATITMHIIMKPPPQFSTSLLE